MNIEKERAAFEAIAAKHEISIEPSPAMFPSDAMKPYKYAHSNHLFAIFRDGWQAGRAAQVEQEPVAEVVVDRHGDAEVITHDLNIGTHKLYTHPQPSADDARDAVCYSQPGKFLGDYTQGIQDDVYTVPLYAFADLTDDQIRQIYRDNILPVAFGRAIIAAMKGAK